MPRPAPNAETVRARFFEKVDQRGPDECWPWKGSIADNGYGQFWDGKTTLAHRKAFFYANGRDAMLHVCHSCDNRSCCNPAHLWDGSHKDNMQDASKKGRLIGPRGDLNGRHSLTENDVREIRRMVSRGYRQVDIAQMFGVSQPNIHLIASRKRWSWLD